MERSLDLHFLSFQPETESISLYHSIPEGSTLTDDEFKNMTENSAFGSDAPQPIQIQKLLVSIK